MNCVRQGDALGAPTVGTWHPACGIGDSLEAGAVLGRVRRAGKWVLLVVPPQGRGLVTEVLPAFSRVEWGTPLVRIGGEIAAAKDSEAEPAPDGVEVVLAPMVGTLYLQNRPGEPAYAPEGSQVERAQTLALVEVMKTLTPVKAPRGGRLVRWLTEDGQSVSQGEPLAWIEV